MRSSAPSPNGRLPVERPHRAKNSVADAILIEVYADMVKERKSKTKRFAFVTHNSKDLSEPNGDRRKPHPDLSSLFGPPRSTYWDSLVDLIKDVDSACWPIMTANSTCHNGLAACPTSWGRKTYCFGRSGTIDTGISVLKSTRGSIKSCRRVNILAPHICLTRLWTVWAKALEAAKKTDEIGQENLGPSDEFEFGMLNGKLSALRWVLGDDWNMLDT
jgi:hypothetical protein